MIYTQVSGRIVAAHYAEGQIVHKGGPLIDRGRAKRDSAYEIVTALVMLLGVLSFVAGFLSSGSR